VKARQLSLALSRTFESDQFPLLNDPNKACIYMIKVKAYWNKKQIAQRTHKTSSNRYKYIYIKYLQGRSNRGFSFPYQEAFLTTKRRTRWKIANIQVVRMSPSPLGSHNHSQLISSSQTGSCFKLWSLQIFTQQNLSKISGAWTFLSLETLDMQSSKSQSKLLSQNLISGLNRWLCSCSCA